ncbi:hypothetical protein [Halomicronema hongdechloris]|uniref:hypothetical protein n=1 Tax=Halomicronema hongdechloris TaxID=1209493 RepID=UPI001650FA6F|nr:hypothetical protein [Halomicronema hongdechloris]
MLTILGLAAVWPPVARKSFDWCWNDAAAVSSERFRYGRYRPRSDNSGVDG